MVELTPLEFKLLSLILDAGAHAGEAEVSRQKLINSLRKRGVSGHHIVETLQNGSSDSVPPKISKVDYGLCRFPFGKNKGSLFMDMSPYDLRSASRWAMSKPDLAVKFAEFIHDVDEFLKQS